MNSLIERDRLIIADLARFRCMSRDHICELYFSRTKQPKTNANFVLKRLKDTGYIRADTNKSPFVYYPTDTKLKMGSQKTDHFLSIVQVYLDLKRLGKLVRFDVEPKYGIKGNVEPDVFAIWQGAPWFIEVQRSNYTDKIMQQKLRRYERFKQEGYYKRLDWQPREVIFPHIWIIGERKYDTSWLQGIRTFQSKSVNDFMFRFKTTS